MPGALSRMCCATTCFKRKRTSLRLGRAAWPCSARNAVTDIGAMIFPEVKACREASSCEEGCTLNRLTKQFLDRFCTPDGTIDWVKLVEFNSGNYDLDRFLPSA